MVKTERHLMSVKDAGTIKLSLQGVVRGGERFQLSIGSLQGATPGFTGLQCGRLHMHADHTHQSHSE